MKTSYSNQDHKNHNPPQ